MTDKQPSPADRSPAAAHMAAERAMIATLLAGTGAMRTAGERYLPKHPAESAEAYAYRVAVSTLYNGMRRTVTTLAGKPFSEPLQLGDDVPASIVEWCEDIDLQGRDLHAFARDAFDQALADGLTHILVEYPRTAPGATLADKAVTGARPYFVHLKHEQILGWRSERIAGAETLTQLRFMECIEEPDGPWATKSVEQVRVLEPTVWTTFRKNEKGEWIEHESGPVTLGAIPLATIYTGRTAFMQAAPPLLDLAWLNIEHWQSSSDQSNILHVARVPILFAAGFGEGTLKIGSGSAISIDDPTAKLGYVEHTGAAIAAGRDSIKDVEERMALMGAQLLVQRKTGTKTATEDAIDAAEADSHLAQMVRDCEDSIEQALQYAADWEKVGPAGTVKLIGDVGGLEEMPVESLLRAHEIGVLSAETVFAELQRRGLVDDAVDWTLESARRKSSPPLAAMPADQAEALPLDPKPTAAAAAAPDFGPLLDGIAALVAALGKPAEPPAPIDLAPLVAAMQAQPAPVVNVTTPEIHVDAPITVNVPEQPAPVVNIAPAAITVEAPQVTVNPAPINVAAPTIHMPPVQVVQPRASTVQFETDADGEIVGARMN